MDMWVDFYKTFGVYQIDRQPAPEIDDQAHFLEIINVAKTRSGLTYQQLADKTGYNRETLRSRFSGRTGVSHKFCRTIAGPLGLDADDLLDAAGIDPENSYWPIQTPEIKTKLARLRLTQKELAAKLGCTRYMAGKLLRGERVSPDLARKAKEMGLN